MEYLMLFRKRQQVTICIVAGLFVADFVLFGYLPLQKRLKPIKQARTAQSSVIAKAATQRGRLPEIRQQLQEMQTVVADFEANVPAQKSIGEFLQQIAKLMSQYSLTEQVVAPGKEIKGDGLNCIPVDMQCKGKLVQIFEFYKRLQDLDRLVRIEQVSLTNDADFSGRVSMQTMAIIYYRPQSESNRLFSRASEKI
jgi:Tfp pilus assembly protein PilO